MPNPEFHASAQDRPPLEGAPTASIWERLRANLGQGAGASPQTADPAAVARKLSARAARLRGRTATTSPVATVAFLGLTRGRGRYGIPIEDVVEVQALDQYAPVPGTPPFIPGVIHWRGMVLALLDLGRLLGIPETGIDDAHDSIIVEAAGRRIALLARQAEEIIEIPRDAIRPAPFLGEKVPAEWVQGVYAEDLLLLRMNAILQDERLIAWKTR